MAGLIDESLDTTITHAPDELLSKPSWIQMGVMSAGVVMNVLLAFVLFTGVIMKTGIPEVSDEPVVAQVVEGMPAKKIGLRPGDRIRSINGEAISTWTELSNIIHKIPRTAIELEIERDGNVFRQPVVTHYQVVLQEGRPDTLGAIGIAPEFYYRAVGLLESVQGGGPVNPQQLLHNHYLPAHVGDWRGISKRPGRTHHDRPVGRRNRQGGLDPPLHLYCPH